MCMHNRPEKSVCSFVSGITQSSQHELAFGPKLGFLSFFLIKIYFTYWPRFSLSLLLLFPPPTFLLPIPHPLLLCVHSERSRPPMGSTKHSTSSWGRIKLCPLHQGWAKWPSLGIGLLKSAPGTSLDPTDLSPTIRPCYTTSTHIQRASISSMQAN